MTDESSLISPNASLAMDFTERYAVLNGIQIYYEYIGPDTPQSPSRPPVVLVHGWTANRLRLHPLYLNFQRAGYPVFRLDLRGHGWSQKEAIPPFRIQDFAADVETFLEEVVQKKFNFQQIILCGHSLGGSIVQIVALNKPKIVSHLILIATSSHWCDRPFDSIKLRIYAKYYRKHYWRLYHAKKPGHAVHGLEHFPMWSSLYNRNGRTLYTCLEATVQSLESMAKFDLRARLPSLHIPTLILAGELDDGAPVRHSMVMQKHIPQSELQIIPGANHDVIIAKPITTWGYIDLFLARNSSFKENI